MIRWLSVYDDHGRRRPLIDAILLRIFGRERILKIRDIIPWKLRGPIEYLLWQVASAVVWPLLCTCRFITRAKRVEKLLGIYDFWEQGGRVGDMIMFYETLNAVRAMDKVALIDIAFIDDKKSPHYRPGGIRGQLEWRRSVMAMHSIIPSVGSVFYFNSVKEFEAFFRDNYHRYHCWPEYGKYHTWPSRINKRFLSTQRKGLIGPGPILDLYRRNGSIPYLSCPPEITDWALDFNERHLSTSLPVVVHIRNSTFDVSRNSNLDAWMEFFLHQRKDSRFKFIIIGHEQGLVPKFREMPNVLFSKDFNTTLEQDLALMQVAHICMGGPSGPMGFPVFTGVPLLKFAHFAIKRTPQYRQITGFPADDSIGCENEFQRLISEPESGELLITEFSRLVRDLDCAGWNNPTKWHNTMVGETVF